MLVQFLTLHLLATLLHDSVYTPEMLYYDGRIDDKGDKIEDTNLQTINMDVPIVARVQNEAAEQFA